MSASTIYELIGYAASALVVASLTMTSVLRLRWLSLAGAATFLVYGVLIDSFPIMVTNVVIVGINVWFLWKAYTDEEYFSLLEVLPSSRYVREFVEFHIDDIHTFFPGFVYAPEPDDCPILVLRNMTPAALVLGRPRSETCLEILVDYALPRYRDFRMGRYLYHTRSQFFRNLGYDRVEAVGGVDAHRAYLKRIGFERIGDDRYGLDLGRRSATA